MTWGKAGPGAKEYSRLRAGKSQKSYDKSIKAHWLLWTFELKDSLWISTRSRDGTKDEGETALR